MILPGLTNALQGMVGGTFDTVVTLYQGVAASIWGGVWIGATPYDPQTVVVGSNARAYLALSASTGVDPVTDAGVHWQPLTPFDLTGYTGVFQINPITATPHLEVAVTLGGALGTIGINVSALTLAPFAAGSYPCCVKLTDGGGGVYFPITGQLTLVSPLV